jgi:transcriptional regulator with XRE-family HTH domain
MAIFPMHDEEYAATYAEEGAMVDASELIADALEQSGMTRADLARKLSVSRSEITALLEGERNVSVRKLARTLHKLGFVLTLGMESSEPKSEASHRFSQYLDDHQHDAVTKTAARLYLSRA